MKKALLLAAVAMVAFVSCNKEIDAPEQDASKGDVTIVAKAPGISETKTMVDGVTVKWAADDHIAIFDDTNAAHDFTLSSGEGTTAGVFTGTIGTSSGWAVYPYTANSAFDGSKFTLDYASTFTYDAVKVPLYGSEDSGNPGKYDFDNVGGAFKIQYTNVPSGATKFVFTSTSNITGTGTYDLSDFTFTANQGKVVTVTSLPSSSTLTFVIPVPAGSYAFDIKLLDSSDNEILGSAKTVSAAKTVDAGHMVPMKAIKVKADKGETLWGEDFEACSEGNQPDNSTATVFNGGRATYAYNGTYTKVYESGVLGSVELLIAKSSRSETWVVSNIPTGSWSSLTLTYKANQNLAVESSDVTVGDASYEAITEKYGIYTRTISDADGLTSFSLTFSMKTDSNARIDDIELIAGTPDPTISVTTVSASSVSSSGATLNGSLALLNGAINASVTEAGFYYKLSAAGAYTKVTCASAPTSTTTFSYDLTGLTKDSEYTYYAYAIYDGGSEVTGKATEKTFTPSSTTTVEVTISSYATSNSWETGTLYTSVTIDEYITASKGGTGTNSGKYYTSSPAGWRFYQSENGTCTFVVSASGSKTIESVTVEYNSKSNGTLVHSDTNISSGTKVDVNASSISFTVGNTTSGTGAQVAISKITVKYN